MLILIEYFLYSIDKNSLLDYYSANYSGFVNKENIER